MNSRLLKSEGFTLIEMMAVIALIGVVFFVALNFYTDLSNASNRASNHTRGIRRASAVLDRVARDIEGTILLVKPAEMDPFEFPWIFLGETRLGGNASERLKFITSNHNPARTEVVDSNLATVAYVVESSEDDSVALYRWASPHLPDSLDKTFPREGDDGVFLLAEGLYSFGFTFLDEDGELHREWDSSTVIQSGSLPMAVEIQLSLMSDRTSDDEEPPIYRKRVIIPIRPLDLAALADPNDPIFGSGKEDDEEDDEEDEDEDEDDGKKKSGVPSDDRGLTNADCIPRSAPADAPQIAKTCVALAKSAPDMIFTKADYQGMPDQCKFLVASHCR